MDPSAYLEHLADVDLTLLVDVSKTGDLDGLREFLQESDSRLTQLLASDSVYDAIFGSSEDEALLRASPFLIFAVLISRAHADLEKAQFVEEWLGPSRRVPVFEVGPLQAFSGDLAHQLFLTEVLASYTTVVSGSFWVHTNRGWHRQRYSELDPFRLIEMLNIVPESQRGSVLRRLGDLALFLTGVFPDFAGTRLFRPMAMSRLSTAVGAKSENAVSAMAFLEMIGAASYRQASMSAQGPSTLMDMAGEFTQARRVLNYVTDRYLFRLRDGWFGFGNG